MSSLHFNKGVTEVCACAFFVPGLFEGVPGANRACAGHQPAAGPAVPAGDRGQSTQQGEGAARPVQHPHRCPGRQLMNSHHHLTRTQLVTVYQWTNASEGGRELAVSTSSSHMSDDVTIYELLENKKILVFFFFFAPFVPSWVYFHLSYRPHVIKQAI